MVTAKTKATKKQSKTKLNSTLLNYNAATVKKVREQMLEEKHLSTVSDFFKVLGDETRMKIIYALSRGELCVTDLAIALEMTQSAVSHQLKLLRMANQVKSRRDGKSIYYSLDDQHVIDILNEALTHIRHKISEVN
ncbi:MAG: winged helix-turn-helix transcriptional regulator [Acidaminococcaceae bacterium]|uniref:ArsR/SmtB family transcription factor n=1 Tax=Succiniclasticum sp. TaxID=2775030 RepID=UPI001B0051DA|nr:metalloregulator ArsR/SmtB family transcription factor [Succiniclasticum sp.]MBO5590430.1 winged helix-turn-helix transcriptional regulator [Acidaminococcaceae bacterium]MDY6289948.1 metalloregulator ArsR/SmtB family transcription factor [Succiniclasticum sp.]